MPLTVDPDLGLHGGGRAPVEELDPVEVGGFQILREQRAELGDWVIHDAKSGQFQAVSRDDVGAKLTARNLDPTLEGNWKGKLANGAEAEVSTLFTLDLALINM